MAKPIIDLNTVDGEPVIIVTSQITHIVVDTVNSSAVYFVGGASIKVQGTLNEIANRVWTTTEG